ncbi:hypothetical protein NQ317_001083 [Molorchus minor]|uniref:Uncharacterized protein n=1 Tax=Molorchus minor TaxID=1323400 RepID=A0ABQ9JPR9_9CUCU|nr:hypothetical protein NQ317_001083 [Molorchus minor]
MKDEFPADPIISFYGTGAKAYHVQSVGKELKKAKGVKKKMNTFRSDLHDIYTEMKNKVALSYHDDKRFVIPNTCKTLPWGHNDIIFYQTEPRKNIEWLIAAANYIDGNFVNKKPFMPPKFPKKFAADAAPGHKSKASLADLCAPCAAEAAPP